MQNTGEIIEQLEFAHIVRRTENGTTTLEKSLNVS